MAALARAPRVSPRVVSSPPDLATADWQVHLAGLAPVEPSPQSDEKPGASLAREELLETHADAAVVTELSLREHPPIPAHESVGLQSYWVQAAEPDQPDPGALKAPVSPGMGEPSGAHVAAAVP